MKRKEVLDAAEQLFAEKKISRADLMKLRFATLNPNTMQQIHALVEEQAVTEGKADLAKGVDWSSLLGFIKELLPIILELIDKLK